jgi:uncharacterized oligopeptide transporter (OPT) family protein
MSADEIERAWFEHVYQGNVAQLTGRALFMGACLGMVMSLSNLYVGLKVGWLLGVAITACILSYGIWRSLCAIFPTLTPMTILENNCMQSTASSAGYSTGGTMVSAVAAYVIITHQQIPWHILAPWTIFLAALGVFLAIPLKRQMINIEQLRFPSGVAAAETLRSLHSAGGEAELKARALALAAALGAYVAWFRDATAIIIRGHRFGWPHIKDSLPFPGTLAGYKLAKYTINWDMGVVMLGAGAIIGWKVSWSLLLGATINYAVLAPWMVSIGAIDGSHLGYRAIVGWSTWTGVSIMVTSGLLAFALQWRTVVRALRGLGAVFSGGRGTATDDPLEAIEVPSAWFVAGFAGSGLGCMAVLHYGFGTTWWMGLVAVSMTFFLGIVSCRATGESDITPIGAMGKVTQLVFGVLAPSNMVTNLMTASVTAGAAASSGDLLTDLKSGYLLGANPRQQFIAQFLGIFVGTIIVVPAFYLLVPDASVLGTEQWPAPAAQVWAKVAQLLSTGLGGLHYTAKLGMLIGGIVGIVLTLLEVWLPKSARRFLPSAMGLGIAFVIPWFNSFSMFVGAALAEIYKKAKPALAEQYVIPVAAGVIAGESLMGIVVALFKALGVVPA